VAAQKTAPQDLRAVGHADTDKIKVTITSPDAGQIIKGDEDISFEGSAKVAKEI